jgi:hypothetical protein
MRLVIAFVVALLITSAVAVGQSEAPRGYVIGPVVELKGTITKVQTVRGRGMPCLEVEQDGEKTTVHLGSMRYLLQQDFSPKAGEQIEVEGFRRDDDEVVAKSVRLPEQDKLLKFRDDDGTPLWQRGRYGQPNRRGRMKEDNQGDS